MTYFFGSNIHVSNIRPIVAVVDTSNQQWKRCDNDADLAVLSYDHTDVDYAWLCNASAYVKAYNSGVTASVATNPTVLKQCGVVPTSCNDLVGWAASDDFGGSGCHSGTWGDTNSSVKFTQSEGSGVYISGGELGWNSVSGNRRVVTNTTLGLSGDFSFIAEWSWSNLYSPASAGYAIDCGVAIASGGAFDVAYIRDTSDTNGFFRGRTNSNITESNIDNITSGKFRCRRVSGTIYVDYDIGAGWVNLRSDSNSANVNSFFIGGFNDDGGSTFDIQFQSIEVIDGASANILIDPTGTSC